MKQNVQASQRQIAAVLGRFFGEFAAAKTVFSGEHRLVRS